MATNVGKKIIIPPKGFMNEIAEMVGCNRHTVRRALRDNAPGKKCDKIRRLYQAKYVN